MIKKTGFLFVVLSILFSSMVFASDDAPPAIPSEYWGAVSFNGAPVPDDYTATAEVDSVNFAQPSQTLNGYYDVILVNGDRELTYNDDRDCSIHWGNGEACVPCVDEADCIEGPQDGADIVLKVDSHIMKPYPNWEKGGSTNLDASSITTVSIPLTTGWNLFSLPLIPLDNSLSNVLSSCAGKYDVVWTTTSGDVWKSSNQFFSPLTDFITGGGYEGYINTGGDYNVTY